MDLEEVQVASATQPSIDDRAEEHKNAATVSGFPYTKETKTPYSRAGASKETPPPIWVCASGMYCIERDVPRTGSNSCFICMKFVHTGCTVNDAQQSTCCIMCEPVAPTATNANATGNTSSTSTSATANATASTVEQRQSDQDVSGMQTDFDNTATGNTSSTSTSANATATATGNTTSTSTASTVEQRQPDQDVSGMQTDFDNTATGNNTSSTSTSATANATATGNTTSTSTASTVEQRQPDQAVSGMQTDFDKLLITQKQRMEASLVVSQAQRNQADFEKGQSRPGPGEQAGKRSRIINVSGSVYSKEAEHQATHQDTPSLPASSVPSVMDFSHKSNDVCSKEARQRESEHQATHQDTPSLPASSVPSVMDSSHKSIDVCRFAKRKNAHRVDVQSDINNLLHVDVLPTPSGLDLLSSPKSVGRDDANNEELTPSIPYGPLFPDVPATDDSTDSGSIFSFDESELEEDTKLIGEHEPPPPPSELEEDMNTVREHEPPPPPPPKGKKSPPPRKVSPRNHQPKHKSKSLKNQAMDFVEIWNKGIGGGVNSNDLEMSLTASKPAARKDKAVSPKAIKKFKKISSTASNSSRRRTRSQSQSTRRGRSTTPRSKEERTTLEQEIENIEEQAKAELLKELKDMEEQQE